jgi:putative acyl-CoA dehydrogenase
MTGAARTYPSTTHDVTNQTGNLIDVNFFDADTILREAVEREGAPWVAERASRLGVAAGDPEVQEHSHLANKHGPVLRSHDRFGHRIDFVEYHPSYHHLAKLAFGSGVQSLAWTARRPGAHVARAALSYLWNEIENGIGCPTGMAYSSIPTLRIVPGIRDLWVDKVLAEDYDPRPVPVGEKTHATIGMALTEKQGGSDLRANSTRAVPVNGGGPGGEYRLTGHKWFCSAPMSDAILTLAHTEKGPTCFFVPRSLPDGTRNRFFIQRLKDKCGNRSNASSEIEYHDTYAVLVGEEGRGIRAAIEMAHLTRLDFAIGSAGLIRWALNLTLHHTHRRRTFQRALAEQPMMLNVLADLCIGSEAATMLAFRLARHIDESEHFERDKLLQRIVTPIAKFWNCKRAPMVLAECVECQGGNGFIEEQPMPRLYREAPLNGIWEGTGNMICLDVLRAMEREPDCVDAFLDELRTACGSDRRYDAWVSKLGDAVRDPANREYRGRALTVAMATAYEAMLLIKHSVPAVADAYVASRLDGLVNRAFGSLPGGLNPGAIIERSRLS